MKEQTKCGCGETPAQGPVSSSPGTACGCDAPVVRETPSCCSTDGNAREATVEATCEGLPRGRFINGCIDTPVGPKPCVTTRIGTRDVMGRWKMRWGIGRGGYRIAPGLYALGHPGADSIVLVTANYKMTFDALRRELTAMDAWILVLETYGINVWCAAGKGTFGTEEIVRRVKAVRLEEVVDHRRLILPQLGAPGVSAHEVRRGCGFHVAYGPVYARDIKLFLEDGMKTTPRMRRVEFPVLERIALMPVELVESIKPAAWAALALFLAAGIGPGFFSASAAWQRGGPAVIVLLEGILGGAVLTPLLLPWLPGKAFSAKGALVGGVLAALAVLFFGDSLGAERALPVLLALPAISSFVAMNFTGATPFTSPSGVEKEMRRAIPVQATLAILAMVTWVGEAFLR